MMARVTLILSVLTALVALLGGFQWLLGEYRAWSWRRKQTGKWLVLACLIWPSLAQADLWTGYLASDRAIDWTYAGVTPSTRTTQCGSTITAYSGTAATINTAIQNCTEGQYVNLGSGTFTLSTSICMANNVTLRGQGADSTKIISTGTSAPSECGGAIYGGSVLFASSASMNINTPANTATWSAGYSKGTTVITLSTVANLSVGDIIFLDQLDDSGSRVDGIWLCVTADTCSIEGQTQFFRADRYQIETARVTAIDTGTKQVTLERGLYMPNWDSGQTPGAYWFGGPPLEGAGLEDLSIDVGGNGDLRGIQFSNSYGSWMKGVRVIDGNPSDPKRCVICMNHGSVKNTIRDSYIYGTRAATAQAGTYGQEMLAACSNLAENIIWEDNTTPFEQGTSSCGNVFSYSYTRSMWYVAGSGTWDADCGSTLNCVWMQATARSHAVGNNYTLFEGNEGSGWLMDAIHGPSFFNVTVRNYWTGRDMLGGADNLGGKTQQTFGVALSALNRYQSALGNIMGTASYHTTYQCANATTTDDCSGADTTLYVLGYSGASGQYLAPLTNDDEVKITLYRWGNWDTVTNGTRWCGASGNTGWTTTCSSTSEVPTTEAFYPQSVPSSEDVPDSFYLSARPSAWWKVGGTTPQWPPIGPDVSGGSVSGMGGHVDKIPARLCWESLSDDANYSTQLVREFNASTCYTDAGAVGGGTYALFLRSWPWIEAVSAAGVLYHWRGFIAAGLIFLLGCGATGLYHAGRSLTQARSYIGTMTRDTVNKMAIVYLNWANKEKDRNV